MMTIKRMIIVSFAALILAVVWYLFRPETLFINKTVDEPFPGAGHSRSVR
jgi:hypothetical protein